MPSDTPAARMRERAAKIARDGCLVPPDGGSPTNAEADMCDRIADAIRAMPDEDEWQPIETAPRNGTWMQVYDPCFGVRAARWDKMFEWWSYAVGDGVYCNIIYRPTMWCPFAAPPKGGEWEPKP